MTILIGGMFTIPRKMGDDYCSHIRMRRQDLRPTHGHMADGHMAICCKSIPYSLPQNNRQKDAKSVLANMVIVYV